VEDKSDLGPHPGHGDGAATSLEDVDFGRLLAIAEPLLAHARRLTEWTHEGPLGHTAAVLLSKVREHWRVLEVALASAGLADRSRPWQPTEDRRRSAAAIALRDLVCDVRRNDGGIGLRGAESVSMAHDLFACRLAVVVELLREITPASCLDPPWFIRTISAWPDTVTVNGITYLVGERNSTTGESRLPGDLLAAANVANGHLAMAARLLELDHQKRGMPDPETLASLTAEADRLIHEIGQRNGAEIVTSLLPQLTAANKSGLPVQAGGVLHPTAHAAACTAALCVATEVARGTPPKSSFSDLDILHQRVEIEAAAAAVARNPQWTISPQWAEAGNLKLQAAALNSALPPLTPDDVTILRVLATQPSVTKFQEDVAAAAGLSRRTVGARLKYLRDHHLTERPHGKKKGETVSALGLQAAQTAMAGER
jgi:DNA-binding transcriptional ArsR family regulator